MSSTFEKSVEEQLTCSICTEILFDPITLLDCLHTNCGSCSKSWFIAQGRSTPTCPICREPVRATKVNTAITALLETFLQKHPVKAREGNDINSSRKIYKPGDILVQDGVVSTSAPAVIPTLRTTASIEAGASDRHSPPSLPDFDPSDLGDFHVDSFGPLEPGILQPAFESTSEGLPRIFGLEQSQTRHLDFGPILQLNVGPSSRRSTLSTSPLSSRPSGPRPNSIAYIVTTGNSNIVITCDSCHNPIRWNVHYECSTCGNYHLCIPCVHRGRTCPVLPANNHIILPQRLVRDSNPLQLQTGLFCSVCEDWLDEPRDNRPSAPNSFFWHCRECNSGHWTYCFRCVRRCWCCNHSLRLFTNDRSSRSQPTMVRGTTASEITSTTPDSIADGVRWLHARQYILYTYSAKCDICSAFIPQDETWFHCGMCADGQLDVCHNCYLFLDDCRCPSGHQMAAMKMSGGSLMTLIRPYIQPPEMCNGREHVAMAIRASWPEEQFGSSDAGDYSRRWGRGEWLCFPKGAMINQVANGFSSTITNGPTIEYVWGTYCGVGGFFEKSCIIFVD